MLCLRRLESLDDPSAASASARLIETTGRGAVRTAAFCLPVECTTGA